MRTNRSCSAGLAVAIAAVCSPSPGAAQPRQATRATTSQAPANDGSLAELNRQFTVRGHRVHPALIERFTRWPSDASEPVVITVNVLTAAGTNEYPDDSIEVESDRVGLTRPPGEGWFNYRWLGTVSPGLHVLETADNGGGSGIFETLYIFRASAATGQGPDGPYPQLLLSVVRYFVLGDRDDGTVTVRPNVVTIGTSRYRTKPVTLTFK